MVSLLVALGVQLAASEGKKVLDGLRSPQGIAVDAEGVVFIGDPAADCIWRWDGKKLAAWREKAGGPAGLRFDAEGNLYVCETRNKRVTRVAPNGAAAVVAETFRGAKFNSPTDLCLDGKGGVYFTDPNYGGDANRTIKVEGVYYAGPNGAVLMRVAEDLRRPHGIDYRAGRLWVMDVGASALVRYHVVPGGQGELKAKETQFGELAGGGSVRLAAPKGAEHPLFFLGTSKAVEVRQGGATSGMKARMPLTPACLALRGDILYAGAGRMLYAVPLLSPLE